MNRLKKSSGILISALLLLCFSVTILPLDFLHNHQAAPVCRETDKNGSITTCNHKIHISGKTAYCWVCAIHFDKTFTNTSASERQLAIPAFRVLAENELTGFFVELISTSLRGPPVN